MIDARPIDPDIAAALADAAPTDLMSLLSPFGVPLAYASVGAVNVGDEMILLSDGHQHGIVAWCYGDHPRGHVYWGSDEELTEHFFGEGHRFHWFGREHAARKSFTGALAEYPVMSA